MSATINLQVSGEQLERLRKVARTLNRSLDVAAGDLIEEGLRQREYLGIEFRDSALGRQAYLRGTRLALWMVALVARDLSDDPSAIAAHLGLTAAETTAAHTYIQAYPDEMDSAIAANDAASDALAESLPAHQVVEV